MDVPEYFGGGLLEILGMALAPVNTSYGIGQNCAADFQAGGQVDLEGISLDGVGHGDNHSQASFLVVSAGRENERGTPAGLLVSDLSSTEIHFDEIAGVGDIFRYHTSFPAGVPQSCSR